MADIIKKTKETYFNELKGIINAADIDVETREDYIAFIDKQIEMLDKKKEASKARRAAKTAESDALTDQIYSLLTDEAQTVEEILVALDEEDLTRAKVVSRLGKLVRAGQATKEPIKVDGQRRTAYTKAKE